MSYTAAVITVSDRSARGQRADTSGPALCALLSDYGWEVVYKAIVPDELPQIQAELVQCADQRHIHLVLTTGGTGFSPRDVTPEATLSVVERLTPGLGEAMRSESMRITPRGCLSRGAAGIRGRTLIVNLPGSEKAARENLLAVVEPIRHGVDMLLSEGPADCASPAGLSVPQLSSTQPPSLEQWLREAKAHPSAGQTGMYLTHCGVVRRTARSAVRDGADAAPVRGMVISCDQAKVQTAIDETRRMEGIFYVRVWVGQGELHVGDDIMRVLVGGDIRPRVTAALQSLVHKLKSECVEETELF